MAMYPNGRHLTLSTKRAFGPAAGLENRTRSTGSIRARFISETFARTASTPDGYDLKSVVAPIRSGSMSAYMKPVAEISGIALLLNGAPMLGTGAITWTTGAGLSLVVSLSGTSALVTFTSGAASLRLTIALDGTGSVVFTSAAGLSLTVPISGSAAMSVTGAADLRGRLSMEGSWTPFSALSPEGLAQAVWGALATANNESGTMGSKLNLAGSGGVDINALATAVRDILLADFTEIKGAGYDTNVHSLVKIKQQASLAAALSA